MATKERIEKEHLIGEVLTHIDCGGDELILTTQSGKRFVFRHEPDCCESVSIVGTEGDWHSLIGKKLLAVEWDENTDVPSEYLPPGFPPDSLDTEDGRAIAADWWEENGNPDNAKRVRDNVCLARESATETKLTFVADGATVINRWIGESNGYYSETIQLDQVE